MLDERSFVGGGFRRRREAGYGGVYIAGQTRSERATKVFHPQVNNWGNYSNVPITEGEIARSKSSSLL